MQKKKKKKKKITEEYAGQEESNKKEEESYPFSPPRTPIFSHVVQNLNFDSLNQQGEPKGGSGEGGREKRERGGKGERGGRGNLSLFIVGCVVVVHF